MKKLLLLPLVFFFLPSNADAAVFYADLSAASCSGDGSSTTTPFCSLNAFTEVARSAGDILHVRRGSATTTGISTLSITSSGTIANPIILTADYDNLWGDFSTSSVTVTVTQGSTTMPTSASTTDITVGDWIYIEGDCYERASTTATRVNPCEYAYEVATATATYLEFYLPYKGFNNGAGKAIRRMPPNPIWGDSVSTLNINFGADDYWFVKGLTIKSSHSTANLQANASAQGTAFMDIIIIGDGATVPAMSGVENIRKFRTYNNTGTVITSTVSGSFIRDGYVNCVATAAAALSGTAMNIQFRDVFVHPSCNTFANYNSQGINTVFARNLKLDLNWTLLISGGSTSFDRQLYLDDFGNVGNTNTFQGVSATTTLSTNVNLRTGGAGFNLYIKPMPVVSNTGLSTHAFPYSYIKLFEYPIYSDGTSKTYTMYFATASSGAFTVSPLTQTASGSSTPELFIECEYYVDPVDADRVTKRSNTANDADFTTTDWQDVSVTCDPSQAGILYLRGYYGKPKESVTNEFYMDIQPIIN